MSYTKKRSVLQEVPVSYKKGAPFCTSVWILERSQARIGLTTKNRKRLKYAIGLKNAEACGLSVSEYCRKRFVGNEPKLHLTEREIEAYKCLSDARGDLVHIRSALKGKTQEQIRNYFNDPDFMREWILAINNIIVQWDTILEQIKD